MENASKALLMAGGVLIGLLVIGALVLMVNQLGSYQKQNVGTEQEKQIAQFNQEFTRFTEQRIDGTDIISLVNKVIDYNTRSGGVNSLNYDIKITLTINIKGFAGRYGNKIFGNTESYVIDPSNGSNSPFYTIISRYRNFENNYGLENLKKLSSNFASVYVNKTKSVKDVTGREISDLNPPNGQRIIEEHREYSEFKSSKFRSVGNPTYDDGQISRLTFEWIE